MVSLTKEDLTKGLEDCLDMFKYLDENGIIRKIVETSVKIYPVSELEKKKLVKIINTSEGITFKYLPGITIKENHDSFVGINHRIINKYVKQVKYISNILKGDKEAFNKLIFFLKPEAVNYMFNTIDDVVDNSISVLNMFNDDMTLRNETSIQMSIKEKVKEIKEKQRTAFRYMIELFTNDESVGGKNKFAEMLVYANNIKGNGSKATIDNSLIKKVVDAIAGIKRHLPLELNGYIVNNVYEEDAINLYLLATLIEDHKTFKETILTHSLEEIKERIPKLGNYFLSCQKYKLPIKSHNFKKVLSCKKRDEYLLLNFRNDKINDYVEQHNMKVTIVDYGLAEVFDEKELKKLYKEEPCVKDRFRRFMERVEQIKPGFLFRYEKAKNIFIDAIKNKIGYEDEYDKALDKCRERLIYGYKDIKKKKLKALKTAKKDYPDKYYEIKNAIEKKTTEAFVKKLIETYPFAPVFIDCVTGYPRLDYFRIKEEINTLI